MSGEGVIVGIGNQRRRDDGVGLAVARLLAAGALPPGVRVAEVLEGLGLAAELEDAARAIVIAAAKLGAPPGSIHVLSPADAEARAEYLTSPGGMTVIDALEMAALVGAAPQVAIVGVEPAEIVPGHTLSPEVEAAVPRAAQVALELALQTPDR
ncbi:MAG: hydrogenase maturation protease [Armatimonadota bacterium]